MTSAPRGRGGWAGADNGRVDDRVTTWFADATSHWRDWDAAALAERKQQRISVVLPARNEQSTIVPIIEGIRRDLIDDVALVDELVVIDSDSSDDTAARAAGAGATVHAAAEIRPDLGRQRGKGEAIWKSQFVTTGDILVFIDADLTGWGTHFVSGLLGPLLTRPDVVHVKGFYDRPLDEHGPPTHAPQGGRPATHAPQGGRVTELVARPLINLACPQLAALVQPLAGEWAVRRSTLEAVPVPVGYGVEMALLLDVLASDGLDAIAQVDLGSRAHVHQAVHDLGLMAAEIIAVFARRTGVPSPAPGATTLWQYDRSGEPPWQGRAIPLAERPPRVSVADVTAAC